MGLIVDNFAGGGGASTGIEAALGRAVDYAINHDEQAIRMHEVNHPGTVHIRNNIWQVDPRDIAQGRPVDLAWFSPDCKHFSKAKGGKPREKSIRDLAWVVVLWAQRVQPALILLENVEEFRTWGPLCNEGKPIKARQGETFEKWCGELRKAGYKLQFRELRACDYGAPTIRKRFFMVARRDGLPIAWPEPTHAPADPEERAKWAQRQRKAGFKVRAPEKLANWRTAAEIIDWSIPCPSIFERKKPLADKTLRRIAHGIVKFVLNNPKPFIVPLTHAGSPGRSYGLDQPLPTVTGANRGEMAVVSPHITKFRNGAIGHAADEPLHTVTANSYVKRPGGSAPLGVVEAVITPSFARPPHANGSETQDETGAPLGMSEGEGRSRREHPASTAFPTHIAPFASYAQQGGANRSAEEPLHTVTASKKDHNTVIAAHLISTRNGEREGQAPRTRSVEDPAPTVTAKGSQGAVAVARLMAAHIEQANGSPKGKAPLPGRKADDPLSTIVAKGCTQRIVTGNLVKLRGTCAHGQPVDEPLHTVSAGGTHMAEVRAFLIKYYGGESSDEGHGLEGPLGTVTVNDRFGLVTVTIEGEEYVIVDIGMRMLTPRELFAAQGFPPDYIIDRDAEGRSITKTAQVAKCGNSVCPPLAEALVRANAAECREAEVEAA